MIETNRLVLRGWRAEDAEALFNCASDLGVGPAAGWPPHESTDESRYVIENVFAKPYNYAVCLKPDDAPIGCISLLVGKTARLTDREDECELGYWIARPYWGRGIATEAACALLEHAFNVLNMNKVWCGFYSGNLRSRAVILKLGFNYSHTFYNFEVPLLNTTRTAHVAVLTKKQWQAAH